MNIVIKIIFLLHFFNDGMKITINSLLPFIAKDFHFTYTQIGILGAAQGLLAMLLAVPMGILAVKVNNLKLIFLSLICYSLCALGIALAPDFNWLFLFFYLAAASFGPFHIVSQSTIARTAAKNAIGRAISTLSMTGDTGRVTVPTIALFIVTFIGWRGTYTLITVTGLVLFLSLLFILRRRLFLFRGTKAVTDKEGTRDWIRQLLAIVRKKELMLITIGGMLDGIGGSAIYLYLPFLFLAKGIPQSLLFVFLGAYFIGSLTGRRLLGRDIDIHGPAKIFITAELLMAVLLITLTMLTNSILIFLITFVLGLFTRGTAPVVTTLFAKISHKKHYEKVFALGDVFLGAASVLSPILLGRIADIFGITMTFDTGAMLAFAAIVPIFLYHQLQKDDRLLRIGKDEQAE